MTTTPNILSTAIGILMLQGCVAAPTGEEPSENVVTSASPVSVGNANISITSSSNTNYCARVDLTNGLNQATSRWQVVIDLKGSSLNNYSGANFSSNTGVVTATPMNQNTLINPGSTAAFTFCASRSWSGVLPVIRAWNMESNVYATCPTNNGLNPTKAALAVAMATELGRWDPINDLTVTNTMYGGVTSLSSTGLGRCGNGCVNVKAILGQQNSALTSVIPQDVFNPTVLATELTSSYSRQVNLIQDLSRNRPAALPPLHKLTLVGGPTNLGNGNCGPHYIYQVDNADGSPLTAAQASNMANALCYFGYGNCGSNPYLGFTQTTASCPSGRTCVAIDPTDGDNSSVSTTTAGSAPSFPLNRAYSPNNSLLGTQCITTRGVLGTMVSKCSAIPSTCGYLYCVPN